MSANDTKVARVGTSRGAKQRQARSTLRPTLEHLEDRLAPAAVVRVATGANTAALQATVDQFRADLGAPNNANTAGPLATGRREINWDGGGTNTTISANPFNGFQLIRGALFTTPTGNGFVQAPPTGGAQGGLATLFSNTIYGTLFTTFSPARLFSPINSNVTDVTFTVPGNSSATAVVRGFGAVFADVDNQRTTSVELFDANNNSLGTFAATPQNNGLSFVGVSFDAGERIGRARITTGNTAPGPNDSAANDVVFMDDFLFGEPQPVSGAASGTVFNDRNGNGAIDPGEPGQSGRVVFLDANNNGALDTGEASTKSGADGTFRLTSLTAGGFVVREVAGLGSFLTTVAPNVSLSGNNLIQGVVVGNGAITSNQAFVAQLHRDVLGREAGVGEFVPLVAALDERTLTHAQVAKTLLNSSESRTRVVSGLYLEVLRRDATPTEVTSGVAFLKAGGTQEQLRARLFGSVEYLTTLGGGTVRGFLEALFRDALGRPIDPASLSGGLNFLARGGTRLVYAVSILRRVESNRREVDLIYRQFLSRPATPDELTARAASLTRGLTNEALVVLLILGSDEYRSRVA